MKSLKKLLFMMALLAVPMFASAQADDGETPPDGGGGGGSSVPIDGGVGLLAAAGVAYGVKKYRDMKKEK